LGARAKERWIDGECGLEEDERIEGVRAKEGGDRKKPVAVDT